MEIYCISHNGYRPELRDNIMSRTCVGILFISWLVPPLYNDADTLFNRIRESHYSDVIMSAVASQITGVSIVCLTVRLGTDQRKHQSSASLAFERRIHRWFPYKGTVTRKMFPIENAIMHTLKAFGCPWCFGCPCWFPLYPNGHITQ